MKKVVGWATMRVFILSLAGLAWAQAKAEKAPPSPPAGEKPRVPQEPRIPLPACPKSFVGGVS
jgi:hypothetical protein